MARDPVLHGLESPRTSIRRRLTGGPTGDHTTMTLAAERELAHIGETAGCSDHDHDLIHELSRRLDAIWRYDQYMANAEWREDLRQFWCDAKAMEKQAIQRLKELIAQEVRNECF